MKTKFRLLFLVIFIFCLWQIGCTKHDNSAVSPIALSVDSTMLNFSYQQGAKDSFDIISNVAWTLSGTPLWVKLSSANGTGNKKIYVTTANVNSGTSILSGSITINATGLNSKTIALSQAFTPLSISSFSPQHAAAGASVTITGQNFSSTSSLNTVTINGKVATVTAATSTSLIVTVPLQAGSGPIVVTVGNQTATSSSFTYDKSWFVSTLAGMAGTYGSADGNGSNARFDYPTGISLDAMGNLYVADQVNNTIRKISSSGDVITIAGTARTSGSIDGNGTHALFNGPTGIVMDGNNLYLTDAGNEVIRKIDPSLNVTTIAGKPGYHGYADGSGPNSLFNFPSGICEDANNNLFIADFNNQNIRKLSASGNVTTIAGSTTGVSGSNDGSASGATFYNPLGICIDKNGNIYIADEYNFTIRKIDINNMVITLAGSAGNAGFTDGTGPNASFGYVGGITVDGNGNIYVVDYSFNTVRMISPSGVVTTIAGSPAVFGSADGAALNATFNNPAGITVDASGTIIYIADTGNQIIRKMIFE